MGVCILHKMSSYRFHPTFATTFYYIAALPQILFQQMMAPIGTWLLELAWTGFEMAQVQIVTSADALQRSN